MEMREMRELYAPVPTWGQNSRGKLGRQSYKSRIRMPFLLETFQAFQAQDLQGCKVQIAEPIDETR